MGSLEGEGVRKGLISRCEDVLRETRSRMRVGGDTVKHFWTGKRVRQGCPLSPGMFNLLTDLKEVMRRGGWEGVRLGEDRTYTLAYADDVVLIAEEEDGMRSIIGRLERYLEKKGLTLK